MYICIAADILYSTIVIITIVPIRSSFTYTQRVVALYLHELSLLQEPPARRQYAWDTLPCQAVLDCQHFLEVFMLSYVLIDV